MNANVITASRPGMKIDMIFFGNKNESGISISNEIIRLENSNSSFCS